MFLFQTCWFGLAFLYALQSLFLYQHLKLPEICCSYSKTIEHYQQDFLDLVLLKPLCFFHIQFHISACYPLSCCISEGLSAPAGRECLCSVLHLYCPALITHTALLWVLEKGAGAEEGKSLLVHPCSLRLLTWEFHPVHKAATIVASAAHHVYFLHVLLGGQGSFQALLLCLLPNCVWPLSLKLLL